MRLSEPSAFKAGCTPGGWNIPSYLHQLGHAVAFRAAVGRTRPAENLPYAGVGHVRRLRSRSALEVLSGKPLLGRPSSRSAMACGIWSAFSWLAVIAVTWNSVDAPALDRLGNDGQRASSILGRGVVKKVGKIWSKSSPIEDAASQPYASSFAAIVVGRLLRGLT